jgi:hypothetical protein
MTLAYLAPVSASAALPPEAQLRARAEARHHLLLRVDDVRVRPGACRVSGAVEQVFRGGLKRGTPVTFDLACLTPGFRPPAGPSSWWSPKDVERARFVEGFFNGAPPALSPTHGQVLLAREAAGGPRCSDRALACTTGP